MKFRKKPIIIETEQWFEVTYDKEAEHGFDPKDKAIYHLGVGYFRHPDVDGQTKCKRCNNIMHIHGFMDTLEGGHTVCPKDWIITGVKGEMYPCKPDIFKQTYELFNETKEEKNDKATEKNSN